MICHRNVFDYHEIVLLLLNIKIFNFKNYVTRNLFYPTNYLACCVSQVFHPWCRPGWDGRKDGHQRASKPAKNCVSENSKTSALAVCNVGFYHLFRCLNGDHISHHSCPQEQHLFVKTTA